MQAALVIIHGLVAVALLGAVTHQALAAWAPARPRPRSFFGRFRTVPSASFASAVVVLYAVSALLGAWLYFYFPAAVMPDLQRDRHWSALGLFDLKEDFAAIGFGLLPAYWISWRQSLAKKHGRTRAALSTLMAFIVWWAFLVGHVVNNIRGFES